MAILKFFFCLTLLTSPVWAQRHLGKRDIYGMETTFKTIKGVGVIKHDKCENCTHTASNTFNRAGFEAYVKSLPKDTKKKCAKGVREGLNILFGHPQKYGEDKSEYGRPAKAYNEEVLKMWQTPDSSFKYVKDDKFRDYDIRVIQPKNSSSPGHIEIFYKGTWYSDHVQPGGFWVGKADEFWKDAKVYRLSKGK
jgi:hypothetical protein